MRRKKGKGVTGICLAGILTEALLAGALLVGCSGGEVDYEIDVSGSEGKNAGTESGTEKGSGLFSDAGPWKEKWSAVNGDGETVSISVDADIAVPDVDQMSVAEGHRIEMDGDFRKQVIEGLFPEAEVYRDEEESWSKERIRQKIDELEAELDLISEYEKETQNTDYWEFDRAGRDDDIERYSGLLEEAADQDSPVSDYAGDYYWTKEGDVTWSMEFYADDAAYTEWYGQYFELVREGDVRTDAMKEETVFDWGNDERVASEGENLCKLTKEEAEAEAERMVAALGLSDLVREETSPLVWYGFDGDDEMVELTDGWRVSYGTGISGVSFRQFGTENDYDLNYENSSGLNVWTRPATPSLNSRVEVRVTDLGVVNLTVSNPIAVDNVTKDVELLGLEKIENILRDELTDHLDRYPYLEKINYFTDLELIYFRVTDKDGEGSFSYVPAWRLSVQHERADFDTGYMDHNIAKPVVINAIDGSVIDLWEEWEVKEEVLL